jgi:hypothetical protein
MRKLLVLLLAVAALAAVVAFVPVGGRSILDRWRSAGSARVFLARGWGEVERAVSRLWPGAPDPKRAPPRSPARPGSAQASRAVPGRAAPGARPGGEPTPVERHTEADRTAVDAIVAEHAR